MEKIATLEIPEGVKSIEIYKTPSGILIDFTRDNQSLKIGDVIVWDRNNNPSLSFVVQNNRNPYRREVWVAFLVPSPDKDGLCRPYISGLRKLSEFERIASEKERLAFLWDIEQQVSYVWDEKNGRMMKKR